MSDVGGERRGLDKPSGRRTQDLSERRLIELTEDFVGKVEHRLRRLERQLYARWAFTFISLLVAAILFTHSQGTASRAAQAAQRAVITVQQGRQASIAVTCAVENGISRAGQDVIDPPDQKESRFTRALERLGYPPLSRRRVQAHLAGRLYAQSIVSRVNQGLQQAGHRPIRGLLRPDGTIDCSVLQRIAANPPRR